MANDLNSCTFIGRLGKDVDMRFMPNGEAVANFSIAVGADYRDKNGNKQEVTEWINIAAYGKLGEVCGEYLVKGSQVYVQGRYKTEKWQDKTTGQDRSAVRIQAERVQFLSTKQADSNAEYKEKQQQEQQTPEAGFDTMEDDIPF